MSVGAVYTSNIPAPARLPTASLQLSICTWRQTSPQASLKRGNLRLQLRALLRCICPLLHRVLQSLAQLRCTSCASAGNIQSLRIG